MEPISFGAQAYQHRSMRFSAQRCVNMYAEIPPPSVRAKERFSLIGTPGLKLKATLGSGPIRGWKKWRDDVYVVSGGDLYRFDGNFGSALVGAVGGTGRAILEANATQLGIFVETTPGTGSLFAYDGTDLTEVTDGDFPGASSFAYLGGYGLTATPNSREYRWTALEDFLTFGGLDFASAEADSQEIKRLFVDHGELWFFKGTDGTSEVWYQSGDEDAPFIRYGGGFIERGLEATWAVTKEDNSVFWLGDDKVFYRAEGLTPTRLSTHAIAKKIADAPKSARELAFCFDYTQEDHKFIVLTVPGHVTAVYDVATQLWHERQSYGRKDWRVNTTIDAFGFQLAGDAINGNVYSLDLDTYDENGEPLIALVASVPQFSPGNQRVTDWSLELDFEMGVGLTSGQGVDPRVMLRFSNDSGRTWSNELWRPLGKKGEYDLRSARFRRLGAFRSRVYEWSISDPVKRVFIGARVERQVGAH